MKKDFAELAVFGLASIISGMLFFFGIMYPNALYTEETYQITSDFDSELLGHISEDTFQKLPQQEKIRLLCELEPSQLQYKSKLWEIIESF